MKPLVKTGLKKLVRHWQKAPRGLVKSPVTRERVKKALRGPNTSFRSSPMPPKI